MFSFVSLLSSRRFSYTGCICGYIYGSQSSLLDDQLVRIEIAFIENSIRGTSLFVRALWQMLLNIEAKNKDVKDIELLVSRASSYNQRLYAKFAKPVSNFIDLDGHTMDVYRCTYEVLYKYAFRPNREKK